MAGKPVIEHILDNLSKNGVEELILVVGHMKEVLIDWIVKNYNEEFKLHFVEQHELLGLAHAVYMAQDYLDDRQIFVMLGDEIFSEKYSMMIDELREQSEFDAAVGTMMVQDPSHYGMLTSDEEGFVTHMVEKPHDYDSRTALAGVYYFHHGEDLKSALNELLNEEVSGREYQLTDALQIMVERGFKFRTFSVGEGYDCGRPESLLKSNRRMLVNNHNIHETATIENSTIVEPCYIGKNAVIRGSKVGPYVSVGRNSHIIDSDIADTIVESSTKITEFTGEAAIFSQKDSIILDPSEWKLHLGSFTKSEQATIG